MPTQKNVETQGKPSQVVKVTGMSEELLRLLDARIKEQRATGRAEYIRELIRRDALTSTPQEFQPKEFQPRRHKARRRSLAASGTPLLTEYHALVDLELEGRLSPEEQARLRAVEAALDRAEEQTPEARLMLMRLEETAGKLDALLAAVQALPKADK